MNKTLGILALAMSLNAQEVLIQENPKIERLPIENLYDLKLIDFCLEGLLYRGFQPLGSYMTTKELIDPASIHQVIGVDGKPMTCKVNESKKAEQTKKIEKKTAEKTQSNWNDKFEKIN